MSLSIRPAAAAASAGAALLAAPAFLLPSAPSAPPRSTDARATALRGAEAAAPACNLAARAAAAGGLALTAAAALARPRARRADARRVAVAAFESELGVQAPVGFFDPLGLTKDGDAEAFKRRRCTELKHGRVSMLACMGYILPEYAKFPGYCAPSSGLAFADIPNGLAALSKVPAAGWLQIFCFIGSVEKSLLTYDASRAPGDFANAGALGVPNGSAGMPEGEARTRKLNAELANGRLAMMAITGMLFQDGLTGSAWGDWASYTDSPLRAFEGELGVQPPLGFWDPLGYAKDGDADVFKRRREAELKHGRVSMFACLGYMAPEFFRFPGSVSPSAGVEFSDVPNGLAALSKVPALGWAQMFLFCGLVDFGLYRADPARAPGDYENAGILGVPNASGPMADAEGRRRKLNAELANGRLAMMAIMGMLFQDGLTGSAWGDWSLYTDSPLRAL